MSTLQFVRRDDGSWDDQHRVALIVCLSVLMVITALVPLVYLLARAYKLRKQSEKYRHPRRRASGARSEHKRTLSNSSDVWSTEEDVGDEKQTYHVSTTAIAEHGTVAPNDTDLEHGAFEATRLEVPRAAGIAHAQQPQQQQLTQDSSAHHDAGTPSGWMSVGAKRYG